MLPCLLVFRWRGSIGRDRSARVSAVGRRANLVLDALKDTAVAKSFVPDAGSIAQSRCVVLLN